MAAERYQVSNVVKRWDRWGEIVEGGRWWEILTENSSGRIIAGETSLAHTRTKGQVSMSVSFILENSMIMIDWEQGGKTRFALGERAGKIEVKV